MRVILWTEIAGGIIISHTVVDGAVMSFKVRYYYKDKWYIKEFDASEFFQQNWYDAYMYVRNQWCLSSSQYVNLFGYKVGAYVYNMNNFIKKQISNTGTGNDSDIAGAESDAESDQSSYHLMEELDPYDFDNTSNIDQLLYQLLEKDDSFLRFGLDEEYRKFRRDLGGEVSEEEDNFKAYQKAQRVNELWRQWHDEQYEKEIRKMEKG